MKTAWIIAIRLMISEEELTEAAPEQFFPQPTVYENFPQERRAEGDREEVSPFIVGEFTTH